MAAITIRQYEIEQSTPGVRDLVIQAALGGEAITFAAKLIDPYEDSIPLRQDIEHPNVSVTIKRKWDTPSGKVGAFGFTPDHRAVRLAVPANNEEPATLLMPDPRTETIDAETV